MRNKLFHVISFLTFASIWLQAQLLEKGIPLLVQAIYLHRGLTATIGRWLAKQVDPETFEGYEAQNQLETQQRELELLGAVTQLKDSAEEEGVWTEAHTEAIQGIGNALMYECGWDEEHIHQYMREAVESLGLTYGVPDEEDDDPLY